MVSARTPEDIHNEARRLFGQPPTKPKHLFNEETRRDLGPDATLPDLQSDLLARIVMKCCYAMAELSRYGIISSVELSDLERRLGEAADEFFS